MNIKVVVAAVLLIVPISGTSVKPEAPSQDLTESLETEEDEEGSFLERQFPGSSGRSPYRLVYDVDCEDPITGEVGKWIKVEKKDCPIVFEDPHFLKHGYICNRDSSDLAVDCNSEFESMWSYPEYQECKNVPVCSACPILAQCGATPPPLPQIGAGFVASRLTQVEYYRLEHLQQKHWLSEQDRTELSCLLEKQRGLRPSWNSCTQGSLREVGTGGHTSHNIHVNVVQESSHQSTNQHTSSHDQSQGSSFDHFSSSHDGSSRTSQVSDQGSSFNPQGTWSQFGQTGSSHGSNPHFSSGLVGSSHGTNSHFSSGHVGSSHGSNSHFTSGHDSSHSSRQVSGQGSSFIQQGSSNQFGHDGFSQGFNHGSSTQFGGQGSSLSHATRTQASGQGSSFSHTANNQAHGQNTQVSQGTRVSGHGTAFAHDSRSHSSGQGSFLHQSGTQFSDHSQNSVLRSSGQGSFSHTDGTQFSGQGQGSFAQQSSTDVDQDSISHTSGTQFSGEGFSFSQGTRTQATGQNLVFSQQQSTNQQGGLGESFSHSQNTEVSSWGTPTNNWGMFDH